MVFCSYLRKGYEDEASPSVSTTSEEEEEEEDRVSEYIYSTLKKSP